MDNLTFDQIISRIADDDPRKPVLIAGCTASGKSALALHIAQCCGGVIVNADSMQVYENWSVLTARPDSVDLKKAHHVLYGHVARDVAYNVGDWLKDVTPFLNSPDRPIIVGGTGLFFRALLEGLADIPATPSSVRIQADTMMAKHGLDHMIAALDEKTRNKIDIQNPARVQRAWEVQETTGRSLADWHAVTPPPLLNIEHTIPLLLDAPTDWLDARIAKRFEIMIEHGALHEAQSNMDNWDPKLLSSKAIGAPELIAYLSDDMDLETAKTAAIMASRQYAKRQRTWFRKRMKNWTKISPNA
ncbi:MAG: tRNA (adenosine(37)-N6)-dimethylallyltransferase MiaA [Planktomarina sp.]